MNGLFNRDYLIITEEEAQEKIEIDKANTDYSDRRFPVMKGCFLQYPKAVRHNLSLFPNNYMDIKELQDDFGLSEQCDRFEQLLTKHISELDIKRFIQDNKYYHLVASLFDGYCFGHHNAYVFKEFKLGTQFIADYVLVGKASSGHSFIFVEFENPYGNIIIGDGDFGDTIRKGINQINDWKNYIASNYSSISAEFKKYTTKQLPDEFYTYDATRFHYIVVGGRRKDFTEKTRRLCRMQEQDGKIAIKHYDNLLETAQRIIGNLTY